MSRYEEGDDMDMSKQYEGNSGLMDDRAKEPQTFSFIYWGLMIAFLLMSIVTCTLAILFGLDVIPNFLVETSIKVAGFKLPIEALMISLTSGFLGLFVMSFLILRVMEQPVGINQDKGKRMYEISVDIAQGSAQFLIREFQVLGIFVCIVFLALLPVDQTGFFVPTPICFVMGAVTSATTSVIGMSIATRANVRTANAARTSLNSALRVAFNAGTVMGLSVVCLGLIMISITYIIFRNLDVLAGFGFGASSIALFARVGGGIYTKAADVGADLVGKVEAGIHEDDPRNPGVIADNVGDNVGDVAGMGADLFESYVGSLIASMVIGAEFYGPVGVACPLYLSGGGILCSVIGSALVSTEEKSGSAIDQQTLLWAIRRGIFSAAGANVLLGALIIFLLFDPLNQAWALFLCFVIGLGAGVLIGLATEYSTSFSYRPTQAIAESGLTGPAPVIIKGLSIGMLSTSAPIVIIVVALVLTVVLGDAAGGPDSGVYGIGIAAVGMLSTLGVTLATDAYGPVADNAGGLAEMAELPHEVRNITDALDALGNTTAATGKGFAIGSAVLTSLALLNAFASAGGITTISLLDKEVISGVILGSCLPYIFSALTMTAVAEAAMQIIVEVRRQFREIDGLLEGREGVNADHRKCVDISTQSSLKKMITPGVLAVVCPIAIGFAGKQKMLGGLLAGSIASGSLLAITMSNAGGAWDNAKKYVEGNNLMDENGNAYKKGSEVHKAVVVGDTVGDPFKDTSGPALNILIKLMTIISLVIAPTLKFIYPDA